MAKLSAKVWEFMNLLGSEINNRPDAESKTDDGFAVFCVKRNKSNDTKTNAATEYNFHATNIKRVEVAVNMLQALNDIIRGNGGRDWLDLGIRIRVPEKFQSELGKHIDLAYGDDLWKLREEERNKLLDLIINTEQDALLEGVYGLTDPDIGKRMGFGLNDIPKA